MMNVKRALSERRSIRKYRQKKISEKIIRELLDAARLAPSACNVQPTKCILIQSQKAKEELKKAGIFPQDWVYNAPPNNCLLWKSS